MKNICVFLGSRDGNKPEFKEAALKLGKLMAENQFRLVYGGGRVGLMGILADAVLRAGGEVIGVIPKALFSHEVAHTGLTKLYEVNSMHERKALMENISEGFIALPGGFGTLDELCEIITWAQIGLHQKPIAILNVEGFFDGFMKFINEAQKDGFIPAEHVSQIHFTKDLQKILTLF
jgi:uncharacterized protein (TIGR00730 family)